MAQAHPLILRLIASSIPVANQAGKIIRDIMKKGELNIVDKVMYKLEVCSLSFKFLILLF